MRLIFSICLLSFTSLTFSQDEKSYNLNFGITASTLSGTETSINKIGFTGGGSYSWFSNPSFGGEVGLSFIQKGAFNPPDRENGNNSFYRLTQNYIQAPLSVLYYRKGITFSAGISLGYLLAFKEENQNGVFPVSEPFRKYEVAAIGGAKIKLTDNLAFFAAINQSLIPVKLYPSGGPWFNRGFYNSSLILGLVCKLNGAA